MEKLDRATERAILGEKYESFTQIRKQFLEALEDVREHVQTNPLVPIYEAHKLGSIQISETGELFLVRENLAEIPIPMLKASALLGNIDIEDCSRSRKKILERIDGKKAHTKTKKKESKPPKKKARTEEEKEFKIERIKAQNGDFDFIDNFEEMPIGIQDEFDTGLAVVEVEDFPYIPDSQPEVKEEPEKVEEPKEEIQEKESEDDSWEDILGIQEEESFEEPPPALSEEKLKVLKEKMLRGSSREGRMEKLIDGLSLDTLFSDPAEEDSSEDEYEEEVIEDEVEVIEEDYE